MLLKKHSQFCERKRDAFIFARATKNCTDHILILRRVDFSRKQV